MLWIELTEVLGITNNQTWNWKRKKQKDETQFPKCPGNFLAAKHFRIGCAACGFTRRWGNDVYTTLFMWLTWQSDIWSTGTIDLNRTIRLFNEKRRGYGVLLEDLQGSTRRSDLSVSLQMYTSKVGILRNWDIMKLQVSWKSFLFCSVHEKYTEYTISADLYSSRVITDSA